MGNYNYLNNVEAINKAYEIAEEVYSSFGINIEDVFEKMKHIPVSLHCWQGDDINGFEKGAQGLSGGGILVTGNYMGRARNGEELRMDLDEALSLIPGTHRVNLHAIYAETGDEFVDRDEILPEYFTKWMDWASQKGIGLDFNPSYFSHPYAVNGTLSSTNTTERNFWIKHGRKCRDIAAAMGMATKKTCINNIWIHDGSKDLPADRMERRKILIDALDEVLEIKYSPSSLKDAVESKLFGIGSESYVTGSHEFYMGYALSRGIMLCLDMGHFHPTESIADKVSSILLFTDELLLHVSRGIRWDSDHVVILNDDIAALAFEAKRCDAFGRLHFALDYFDASINRITAWVIGARAFLKAVLQSLLEPSHLLVESEKAGRLGDRLALMEEFKALPHAAIWNKYCLDMNVPVGPAWLTNIMEYEDKILSKR
ncbi:MAG: L-rhamnose isomerase [Clostridiales bacterium]|nr:L-rhamnose isomerase [Clostridiales bacterium]